MTEIPLKLQTFQKGKLFLLYRLSCLCGLSRFVFILQVIELLVPALIILGIGSIKRGIKTETLDASSPITDTPVVTYEAMQNASTFPNVLCYDDNMFMRYFVVLPLRERWTFVEDTPNRNRTTHLCTDKVSSLCSLKMVGSRMIKCLRQVTSEGMLFSIQILRK